MDIHVYWQFHSLRIETGCSKDRSTGSCYEQIETVELRLRYVGRELEMRLKLVGVVRFLRLRATRTDAQVLKLAGYSPAHSKATCRPTRFVLHQIHPGVSDHGAMHAAISPAQSHTGSLESPQFLRWVIFDRSPAEDMRARFALGQ